MLGIPRIAASDVPRAEWVHFDGEDFRVSQRMLVRQSRNPLKGLAVVGTKVGLVAGAAFVSRSWGVALAAAAVAAQGHHFVAVAFMSVVYLVGGKKWTTRMSGIFVPSVCGAADAAFRPIREELMKTMRGVVLDVGAGGGAYVKYSVMRGAAVARHVALEPNVHCHGAIRAAFAKEVGRAVARGAAAETLPRLELEGAFLSEFAAKLGPASVDWIILGNVLCELPEPGTQLRLLDGVLKPGGRVFFSEHVRDAEGSWVGALQDAVAGWWERISDGCVCNRRSLQLIRCFPTR